MSGADRTVVLVILGVAGLGAGVWMIRRKDREENAELERLEQRVREERRNAELEHAAAAQRAPCSTCGRHG